MFKINVIYFYKYGVLYQAFVMCSAYSFYAFYVCIIKVNDCVCVCVRACACVRVRVCACVFVAIP
jgi:hypothetical protein